MKIYMIRHGEVFETGSPRRYLGVTDIPMTEEGKRTVERTAASLAGVLAKNGRRGVKRVLVTSPLTRCRQTADILKEVIRFDAEYEDEMLREIDLGEWEMKEIEEVRRAWPERFENRGKDIETYRTPGGETFREAGSRFAEAAGKWTERARAEGAAELFIVSHRGAILSGIGVMTGTPYSEMLKEDLPYGGVIECGPGAKDRRLITEVEE